MGVIGGRPGTGGAGTGSTLAPDGMEMPEALAVLTAAEAACNRHELPLLPDCSASAGKHGFSSQSYRGYALLTAGLGKIGQVQ